MLEMINRSLDMLKMEQGTYELTPEPVDLLKVVQRIVKESKVLSAKLMVNGSPVKPNHQFIIQGEELLCYSMMSNLIKNAIEASPEGAEITISMDSNDKKIIRIHNYGVVPEEVRDRFFEKYLTYGKKTGTGLGTYSAKLIAETLGGTIQMETSNDVGTVVTFFL